MVLSDPVRENMATTYGMWRDSELNRSNYFHVTTGMVPDIMQDILEGSLYQAPSSGVHLLAYKLFSLSHLNLCIKAFAYGVDNPKPSELSVIHHTVR